MPPHLNVPDTAADANKSAGIQKHHTQCLCDLACNNNKNNNKI